MTCYACPDRHRLLTVQLAGAANGIEYLEVRDHDEVVESLRQRTLYVRLLLPVPAAVSASWVVIDGGERIRTVGVEWARPATDLSAAEAADLLGGFDDPATLLVVRTAARGDFSRYRFALVAPGTDQPPAGFDPLLAEVSFSFKVECPSDFDCLQPCTCPPGVHHPPPIDYLAKDYPGFRRVMLERMSLLAPGWTERSSADAGVALVELLAYAADELSYRQDAVATEAYLGTARSRVSLRRHARLVDYRMHDGANARVWARLHVAENATAVELPAGTGLLTAVPGVPSRVEPGSREHEAALAGGAVVFATVEAARLDHRLDELRFWTWGRTDAALPAGATSATLRGHHEALRAGEVLVLGETISPVTSEPEDADPSRRFAVRLVEVRRSTDPAGHLFPPDGVDEVTEIRWHPEDALPRSLCLADAGLETARAWGNIVLADHGGVVTDEPLGTVPDSRLARAAAGCDDDPVPIPARFRPALASAPLTMAVARPRDVLVTAALTAALDAELQAGAAGDALQGLFAAADVASIPDGAPVTGEGRLHAVSSGGRAWLLREDPPGTLEVLEEAGSATSAVAADPRQASPALMLSGAEPGGAHEWTARGDLLSSDGADRAVVVEAEHDGTAYLRFGDDEHGMRPAPGTSFTATYRVGNGVAGNIGRDGLGHVVTAVEEIAGVSNPLPARGGVEPESGEQVRRDAPATLARQERAVTEADYAEKSGEAPGVSRAAATFRWTGSWHTVFVTADRVGGGAVDDEFEAALRGRLERYRMAGYDLEVDGPRFVPLEVALHVCVEREHHRSAVARDLRSALSDEVLPDGRTGLFHPDRFTFGQPVYLSSVLAAAHAVAGVESVEVLAFQRQRRPETSAIGTGVLTMGRLEIARLDDDPNFPERGVLELSFGGGS
ncbi:putative baseplate assembly protein [Agromyces sp. ZXT2-3]|uniref:putative baseplate assembly protein n=1 Tax=Agromyces sp. ZXT2-3 TaxID=3461152 RepID=UPI004054A5C1